jgi:hypothetical protein
VAEHCPKLHKQLICGEMVSCSIFLIEWMITLFSSTLKIEVATFIWDQVFIFGEYHIMRVAIAISTLVEQKVKQNEDLDI